MRRNERDRFVLPLATTAAVLGKLFLAEGTWTPMPRPRKLPAVPAKFATIQSLRQLALRLPGTEEGVACAGTSLEKRTIKARGKAFLFLGTADAMLKLDASLPEAKALAAKEPDLYKPGATGWVKVVVGDRAPALALLGRWIEESYGLVIGGPSATAAKRGAKQGRATTAKKAARPRRAR